MFMSEPLHPDAKSETGTLSCPTETSFTYGFAILFNWDEKVQKPFKIFPRKAFSTDDIRDRCYEKVLVDEMRIRKLKPLKPLPGQKMSLFAKVESCKYKKKIDVFELHKIRRSTYFNTKKLGNVLSGCINIHQHSLLKSVLSHAHILEK